MLVTFSDQDHSDKEERFISIGTSANAKILLTIHTEVDEADDKIIIRIIS
ncbi:MAG: hypothetical protein ACT4O9_16790 [Blastocatellia bacterium]